MKKVIYTVMALGVTLDVCAFEGVDTENINQRRIEAAESAFDTKVNPERKMDMLTLEETREFIADIKDLIQKSAENGGEGRFNIVIADSGNDRFVRNFKNTIFIDPIDTAIKQTDAENKNFKYIKAEFEDVRDKISRYRELQECFSKHVNIIFVDCGNGGGCVVTHEGLKYLKNFLSENGKIFVISSHLSSLLCSTKTLTDRVFDYKLIDEFDIAFPKNATRKDLDWIQGYEYEADVPGIWQLCPEWARRDVCRSRKQSDEYKKMLQKWGINEKIANADMLKIEERIRDQGFVECILSDCWNRMIWGELEQLKEDNSKFADEVEKLAPSFFLYCNGSPYGTGKCAKRLALRHLLCIEEIKKQGITENELFAIYKLYHPRTTYTFEEYLNALKIARPTVPNEQSLFTMDALDDVRVVELTAKKEED